jgi:hypothetical protein
MLLSIIEHLILNGGAKRGGYARVNNRPERSLIAGLKKYPFYIPPAEA